MSEKVAEIRIDPPIVEFKDCDVGTLLKRKVRVINFGKVSKEVRFLSKPSKVGCIVTSRGLYANLQYSVVILGVLF